MWFILTWQLNSFKEKCLLQNADLTIRRNTMHDLYYEFVELEASRELGEATDMGNQRWVYVKVDMDILELESTLAGRCWEKLT